MFSGKKLTEEKYNELRKQLSQHSTISEHSGTKGLEALISKRNEEVVKEIHDKSSAEIELSYIRAAISLANGSNDIGAEIVIGPFTIGISLNKRLVQVLEAEAIEIEKYLRGEQNNYE